jgi:hypothetical protein
VRPEEEDFLCPEVKVIYFLLAKNFSANNTGSRKYYGLMLVVSF